MAKDDTKTNAPRIWIRVGITRDLDYFIENLSMLVSSGMSMLDAIRGIGKELRSKKMRQVGKWISDEIEAGSSLSDALLKTKLFPDHIVTLIHIGEETGKLSENLALVGVQQKKDRMFRSKLKSALMYPIFVLSLTLIVGTAIAWFILPKLALVFGQLRIELPLLTTWLIASGHFLSEWGFIAVPAFLGFVALAFYVVFYFPKTKIIGQIILFHFPGTGGLIQQVEIARFSYLLGTLLEAGLPITRALESLEEAATFPHYKKFYAYLKTSVEEGNSLQKSFAAYKKLHSLIPSPVQQVIVAGEKSGKLSESLSKINETYEANIETTTKNLTVILEPVLLVIVWLGVVGVALAVILPIYNLIGGFNADPTQRTEEEPAQENVIVPTAPEITVATSSPDVVVEPMLTLTVLENDLGYLNVRDEASTAGMVIGRVYPGESYEYTEEDVGWYRIILEDESGWVYGDYVEISETNEE
ncbi:MAG: type II secretion system F family protein [Candidatus Paceibacterota bacterium]